MNAIDMTKVIDIAAAGAPAHDTPNGGKVVLLPPGYQAHSMQPLDPKLLRITQKVTLHDRDSFVAYVNRYKTEATRLFAEPGFLAGGAAHVTAVIDYHKPSEPLHGVHVAVYTPRYSEQWLRWQAVCKGALAQVQFAELVEEARADIVEPEAAKLLDIVRAFKASKKVEFDSVVYQSNGDVTLGYDEKTQQRGASGPLPEVMKLGIPVYFRGATYAVPLFVRFKVDAGSVKFTLKLDRADVIEDAAFGELTKAISEAVEIGAYLGRR